jgi:hypothetical protein
VQLGPSAKQSGSGSFAFSQVQRLHRLAGVELVFQRNDFGSDVTTGGRALLENVIGGKSGHHVRMSGHEDPRLMPGISGRVSMRAMVFIRAAAVLPALAEAP